MCVAAASYFPRESPGRTLVAGGLASSRERESQALWLKSQQPVSSISHDRMTGQWRAFFSVVGQWPQW